jgi:hypothetical protein
MPACGSTSKESAGGSVVVGGDGVDGVEEPDVPEIVDAVGVVDAVLRGGCLAVVGALLRCVAGAEQPALSSATPATTVSTHARRDARVCQRTIAGDGGDQLASWTTVASPTLA